MLSNIVQKDYFIPLIKNNPNSTCTGQDPMQKWRLKRQQPSSTWEDTELNA